MYILGISCFYHDSAAALLRDGEIIAAAQEERFTRIKHDPAFPQNAVDFCLKEAGIGYSDVRYVVFYEKPIVKFDRVIETFLAYAPRGFAPFQKAIPLQIGDRLKVGKQIYERLPGFAGGMLFSEHHLSHASAAFYPSPFEEAAILTVDGVGEWCTTSIGRGQGNKVELLKELRFPHSLGMLYSAFTYYLGFRVNNGEYKVMGLAPYGEPIYADKIRDELVDIAPDGSFNLNMKYFDFAVGKVMINRRFEELFGFPTRARDGKMEQHHFDLAHSVQEVTEEIVLKLGQAAHVLTGLKQLCMAGGVALNCVANGRLLREGPFEEIWIQPAAGDAGGALGAALGAHFHHLGSEREPMRPDSQKWSYLGSYFDNEQIEGRLKAIGAKYESLKPEERGKRIAELIKEGQVVGYFDGRAEFGPRALGSRSILGDARDPEMKDTINLKIKFREAFRPFAPSVAREAAPTWFNVGEATSPYMLLTTNVLEVPEDHRVPSVTHVDGSARLQTVEKGQNPRYREVMDAFGELTGVPIIINTSLNVRGEPIVDTPEDAYRCFMKTHMDYLVVGDFLLSKQDDQPEPQEPVKEPAGRAAKLTEFLHIKHDDDSKRTFGTILSVILSLIAGVSMYRIGLSPFSLFLAVFAPVLFFGSQAAPKSIAPVYYPWTGIAGLIGKVVNTVLMGSAFYLVTTPTALIMRLTGRDELKLKGFRSEKVESYFIERTPESNAPERFARMF